MKYFLTSLIFLMLAACGTKKDFVKPNILLIVIDDLGYADFNPTQTPQISRLGRSGTIYTQAYVTAPVCSPSRAGIITGKNQFRWDKPASWGPGLPDDIKTIAEYLQELGYETARIGKNDLGRNFHKYDEREYPLRHGYDEFLGFSAHAHDYWLNSKEIKERTPDPYGTSALLGPLMYNEGEKSYEEGYLTDIFTDESIQYMNRKRENPFFLTLSYSAVHHLIHEVPQKYLDKYEVDEIPNYNPDSLLAFGKHKPGSYSAYYDKYSRVGDIKQTELRKYYLANLNCLDDNIGQVLDALDDLQIARNTLVLLISDNGGSPLTGSDNSPLTGGKYSLWEGGIRVPMMVRWPEKIQPGVVEGNMVSALDIFPTLAQAASAPVSDPGLDGISLLEKAIEDRLLIWKWQKTWAVRKGDWKLTNAKENHWKSEPSAQYIAPIRDDLTLKLFNIKDDKGERNDLSQTNPTKVKELQEAYDNWCKRNIN